MLARIILPLALEEEYTYRVPEALCEQARVGMRALVQFGSKRYYYAIISQLIEESDRPLGQLKSIIALPDREAIVTQSEIDLWRWGATYYICSLGAWLTAAIPSSYLPSSETQVAWREPDETPEGDQATDYKATELSEEIRRELLSMRGHQAKVSKLAKILGDRIYPEIDRLLHAGVLIGSESIPRYSRSVQVGSPAVQFAEELCSEESLSELVESLSRAKAQRAMVEQMIDLLYQHELPLDTPLLRETLVGRDTNRQATLRALIKRDVLRETATLSDPLIRPTVQRTASANEDSRQSQLFKCLIGEISRPVLYQATSNEEQIELVVSMVEQMLQRSPSAQVAIYVPQLFLFDQSLLYSALQQLARGGRAARRTTPFDLVLYSSSTTDAERMALRARLLGLTHRERGLIVLTSRMGSLLPLSHCDLVIVTDEESSRYKQSEPAPRYHARDLTVVACKNSQTPLLLTTVAPSAEALYNVERGYYCSLNQLSEPTTPTTPTTPKAPRPFELIDLSLQRKQGKLPWGQMLSIELRKALLDQCQAGHKSILLLNRRGYAPHLVCRHCQKTLQCPNCDVGLVYHKSTQSVSCSYCNFSAPAPRACPHCHQSDTPTLGKSEAPTDSNLGAFSIQGYGVERIAEELTLFIPSEIPILELSASQYYNKESQQRMRQLIRSDEPAILVGTSSLIYLDAIRNVGLIGLANLDQLIVGDDFRANERAYAALSRFGSNYPTAQLYIQSYQTDTPLLDSLQDGATAEPYGVGELAERKYLHFPPYVRLIYIYVRGASEGDVCYTVATLSRLMQAEPFQSLWQASAPIAPYVSWVRMRHIRYICMRIRPSSSWREVRTQICHIISTVQKSAIQARRVQIYCDVDPL
ncbi:primosomal protein N' [Porphyromonas uenonis]|uniref:primosomal protein N' family DNA-binding protein n=1 Tax=Porphyromonas uenonis TaxID=281920 RepID=UPI000472B31E|nr:primosomal protein N' [Porphyromonas uenonis]